MPRRSVQAIAREWEEQVKTFFNRLGFDVDGGESFRPGGKQIDLVAGIHNILFIGECKTKQELGRRGDLKSEIEKFRKNSIHVIRALQDGYEGGKFKRYSRFELIVATKDIVWTTRDFDALNAQFKIKETLETPNHPSPHPCIENGMPIRANSFEEELLEYYKSIESELSADISRYHLLADFYLRFPAAQSVTIPAFKSEIKGVTVYNFVVTPQEILKNVYVARREARRKEYYQRMVNGDRCQKIINYLDSPVGHLFPKGPIIPGNIILATTHDIKLEDPEMKTQVSTFPNNVKLVNLTIPNEYGVLQIVDGQHRLYAYSKSSLTYPQRFIQPDDKVFVTLLHDSKTAQHRRIFIDMNNLHKGIDKDYIIDMVGEDDPLSADGRISNVIKRIDNIDKLEGIKNYFYKNIRIPSHGTSKRKFSMKGFYQAIRRRDLVLNKLRTESVINPFFRDVDLRDTTNYEKFVDTLSKNIVLFFAVAIKVLGDDLASREKPPKYDLYYWLRGRGKEGIADVLIGFYERILAAKYKKSGRSMVPGEEDFRDYLGPVANHLGNIRTEDEIDSLIATAGHGPRDDTVRRICSVVADAGFEEFKFDDLDLAFNRMVDQTILLEAQLRGLVNDRLSKLNPDWCKSPSFVEIGEKKISLLDGSLFNRLKDDASMDLEQNPDYVKEGKLYKSMLLNNVKSLIIQHWGLCGFDKIFVVGGTGFTTMRQFEEALEHLTRYRNTKLHSRTTEDQRKVLKKEEHKKTAEIYLKIFGRIFDILRTIEEEEPEMEVGEEI